MNADLTIHEAVKTAIYRKVQRLAAIRDELDQLGYLPFIQPHELMLLEDHGFMLDFDSGRVVDTLTAVDAEVVPA